MARMCTSVGCALMATWPNAGCLMLQVMASVAAALRRAVEVAGPRLVEAHYAVQIATTAAGLDAAASVIKARRGQVLKTEPREGQDLFVITASVPVEACLSNRRPHIDDNNADDGDGLRPDQSTGQVGAEADRAGFAEELRQASSGAAAATLAPSHWDRLQVEMKPPYGIPFALQHVLISCYVLFWASIAAINCSCCLLQWLCCAAVVLCSVWLVCNAVTAYPVAQAGQCLRRWRRLGGRSQKRSAKSMAKAVFSCTTWPKSLQIRHALGRAYRCLEQRL